MREHQSVLPHPCVHSNLPEVAHDALATRARRAGAQLRRRRRRSWPALVGSGWQRRGAPARAYAQLGAHSSACGGPRTAGHGALAATAMADVAARSSRARGKESGEASGEWGSPRARLKEQRRDREAGHAAAAGARCSCMAATHRPRGVLWGVSANTWRATEWPAWSAGWARSGPI